MKLSEIARYWAAKELTSITVQKNKLIFKAPFSSPGFSVKLNTSVRNPRIEGKGEEKPLVRIKDNKALKNGNWYSDKTGSILCFDLEKGTNELIIN
jgi:hypothetical protein